MDINLSRSPNTKTSASDAHHPPEDVKFKRASDALPLPLYLTNGIFFILFLSVAYFLLHRWRDKIHTSTPLHVLSLSEISALFCLVASVIYLLGFFGIDFVQSFISRPASHDDHAWLVDDHQTNNIDDEQYVLEADSRPPGPCPASFDSSQVGPHHHPCIAPITISSCKPLSLSEEDEEIIKSVVSGTIPSYSLESKLGDCKRAAAIRREALQKMTGKSLEGMPLEGFDYESILCQCCEMPVGYVQIPVGVAGPLLLDEKEYTVPMATTEGCLVASTNRGCKAIYASGGATSVLLKDGMTRAPVVRFGSAKRAAELKFFMEDPLNFDTLATVFNRFCFYFLRYCYFSFSVKPFSTLSSL